MSYVVAVDIGGTFTDFVAYDHSTNEVRYTKSPTTYGDLADAIFDCFSKTGLTPQDAAFVHHGTTLVINALIQRRGARAALITTAGFRDVLEIARGNRPNPFDLYYQRDEPLIPRELRLEVRERMGSLGEVIEPLDEAGLIALTDRLRAENVDSVAIFFMHSYANPAHEERAAAIVREHLPNAYVTHSTELTHEWYEYERCSTVAANAYVGPQLTTYVRQLEDQLQAKGFTGRLFLMGSNGGVLSAERTLRQPIALVESGPIGGCIGAGAYAEILGLHNVVAFDMGGTTAKCALVEDGRYTVENTYYANGYVQGFPVKSPVIDIVEVGSGGGSIAYLDAQQRLHVGPRSAGSTPGPVCYGRGGTEPTVTDANLVLGRINPAHFLGGELRLDQAAAEAAIAERIAEPLGYRGENGVVQIAEGIVSIATVIMAGAIRRISVEHGRDPRDFVLFAYGGGGPLHASALARELAIPRIVIPPEPGTFSATGILLADARLDESSTFVAPLEPDQVAPMETRFVELERSLATALKAEFGSDEVTFVRFAEMRYRGQRHNIRVPVSGLSDVPSIRAAFERDYQRRYGHADERTPAEFQALHLSAFARQQRPQIERLPRAETQPTAPASRPVYFAEVGAPVETQVYDRYALTPGFKGVGPAVIEEYGSTTIVGPRDRFEIGPLREIRIDAGVLA